MYNRISVQERTALATKYAAAREWLKRLARSGCGRVTPSGEGTGKKNDELKSLQTVATLRFALPSLVAARCMPQNQLKRGCFPLSPSFSASRSLSLPPWQKNYLKLSKLVF